MIFLNKKADTLMFTLAPYLISSLARLIFWIMTAMCSGEAPLTFCALTCAYLSVWINVILSSRLTVSITLPFEMAWKSRLLPGNSGNRILFITPVIFITKHQYNQFYFLSILSYFMDS